MFMRCGLSWFMLWLREQVRETNNQDDDARVYLARTARASLTRLNPTRRAALTAGFQRVWRLIPTQAASRGVDGLREISKCKRERRD